jgi:hypothetical protein
MKKLLLIPLFLVLIGLFVWQVPTIVQTIQNTFFTGAPPYDPSGGNVSKNEDFTWLNGWKRPDGPTKVALQVGHWKNDELPEELERLRGNTGASGGGKSEWEVNYEIARETQKILEEKGIIVELLPTAIPKSYFADVFVSIHADGHPDLTKTGFKASRPRRDYSGKADKLVSLIKSEYASATDLVWDEETITRNMRGYYAFSWWRYEHAVHPMTVSAILETGFLTSPTDQELLIVTPEIPAEGLANAIEKFLIAENLLIAS